MLGEVIELLKQLGWYEPLKFSATVALTIFVYRQFFGTRG